MIFPSAVIAADVQGARIEDRKGAGFVAAVAVDASGVRNPWRRGHGGGEGGSLGPRWDVYMSSGIGNGLAIGCLFDAW